MRILKSVNLSNLDSHAGGIIFIKGNIIIYDIIIRNCTNYKKTDYINIKKTKK